MATNTPRPTESAGSSSAATPASNRREALRQQREAEAARQRRNRLLKVLAGLLALVLVIGGITWAVVHHRNEQNKSKVAAVTPPNAVGTNLGIAVKPAGATAAASDAPLLYEYQDYQCPTCKAYVQQFGTVFNSLVQKGELRLQYRTLTFLDKNEQNDASERSAIAAACADTVGAYEKYHDVVYANQPAKEGDGYTDQQLRADFAQQAGITGENLTSFQKCYDQRATQKFVDAVDQKGESDVSDAAGKVETPTFMVDKAGTGVKIDLSQVQPTEAAVLAAIKKAAA